MQAERQQDEAENNLAAEEEEAPQQRSIDEMQSHGINASDLKKLSEAGIATVAGVLMMTTKSLCEIKGMSDAKVAKIREVAAKIVGFGFATGTQMLEKRKKLMKITSGSDNLDQLLGGGFESGSITEIFGEFRTGKTQICHTLCVTAQLPRSMKGGNGKVAYIDTEGTFRAERIVEIAGRFGVDPSAVLDNIIVARAYTHESQIQLLTLLAAKMAEECFSLLVVDSSTALFRVDFSGRGELAERQQVLGKFLSRLTKLGEEYGIAVVITNQVVSDPGGGAVFISDPKKPIGGHIMAHASTTRLFLRKGKGDQRICKMYDSPCLPESEAIFQLCTGGVENAKD